MFDDDLIECPNGHTRAFRQFHNGRSRLLRQVGEGHIKKLGWIDDDPNCVNGLYCEKCADGQRLELSDGDLASFGLDDLPLEVPAHASAAARLVEVVHALVDGRNHAVHTEPARAAVYGREPNGIPSRVRRLFPDRLYVHQSEAIEAALAGHDVVQTTGTGSGKSVGMWAPVISTLVADPHATAVAVFPRIALGNDQIDRLVSFSEERVTDKSLFTLSLGEDFAPIEVGVMNHHTKDHHAQILKRARLIVTTPDQLHTKILPNMKKSSRFVAGLRFVILDEIHTYTGQEGSTMTALLQRLQIDCLHQAGATPQFLMSSASLSNVEAFTSHLTARHQVTLVSRDGSPKKEFTTFVVEADHREFIPELHTAIARGFDGAPPTGLTFVQSKEGVKILAEASKSSLDNAGYASTTQAVIAYSSQDDAGSRTDKEGRIGHDDARFVLTTSALELGVDFTNVHYAVTTEFAGLVMETRQRLGRAGRQHAGVGIVLIEPRKQPSWPMTPAGALETILSAPATIQPPEMTSHDRETILAIGLAHDLDEIDLDLVRHVDSLTADQIGTSEYWQVSGTSTATQMCFDKLAPFRGTSEKGFVLASRGNRILAVWNGSDLVRLGWCGNRLTTADGRQYEVVSVKRRGYGDGDWEIRVELAEDFLEVESSVYTRVIDEVVSTSDLVGQLTLTRSEGRIKHSLSSSRRREPGREWVAHQSSRRVNQTTSQRMAVTSIRFGHSHGHVLIDNVRCLIMSCLDAIGISQFDIWSDVQGDRILFFDPQGRTSPIAWSIIDRLDELVRVAALRIAEHGYLDNNGFRIEREDLDAALQLFTTSPLKKAA